MWKAAVAGVPPGRRHAPAEVLAQALDVRGRAARQLLRQACADLQRAVLALQQAADLEAGGGKRLAARGIGQRQARTVGQDDWSVISAAGPD